MTDFVYCSIFYQIINSLTEKTCYQFIIQPKQKFQFADCEAYCMLLFNSVSRNPIMLTKYKYERTFQVLKKTLRTSMRLPNRRTLIWYVRFFVLMQDSNIY